MADNIPNPLKGAPLKDWPDYPLVLGAVLLVIFVLAWLNGIPKTGYLSVITLGTWMFALAGKIAHFKKRDKNVPGNVNAWFPAWRHSFLADSFAIIGIILICFGVAKLLGAL